MTDFDLGAWTDAIEERFRRQLFPDGCDHTNGEAVCHECAKRVSTFADRWLDAEPCEKHGREYFEDLGAHGVGCGYCADEETQRALAEHRQKIEEGKARLLALPRYIIVAAGHRTMDPTVRTFQIAELLINLEEGEYYDTRNVPGPNDPVTLFFAHVRLHYLLNKPNT